MKNKTEAGDKKLKQARLPFKTLSPRSPNLDKSPVAKKRKLSNSTEGTRAVVKKVFVKENVDDRVSDVIEIHSDQECETNNKLVPEDKSNKGNHNFDAVVCLVDNVEELLKQSTTAGNVAELIETPQFLSDNSNSSKENCETSLIDEECDEHLVTRPVRTTSDTAVINNDIETDIRSSNDEDLKQIIQKEKCPKTPTQINKTPKQIQSSTKKKEEREKARLERERIKQEEKEERLRQKQEKDEQRRREKVEKEEQRRKEKDEKEELRRKEKDEKEKKRLAEIEQKNVERRLKEEDRKKKEELKEEERRKKELLREEKLKREEKEKEEAEQKKKKAAAAFVNFFVAKKKSDCKLEEIISYAEDAVVETKNNNFMPFSLKADMRLAPIQRHIINDDCKKRLENVLNTELPIDKLYLSCIKDPTYSAGKSFKTWEISEKDIVIIAEEGEGIVEACTPKQFQRPKLLQFHENRRPPYWGTWIKRSATVGARSPFGKDKVLDYEIDSDSEWEEEEPGESLHGSDDEKEKESDDEYEVDNDFFVPHGYLSDEEHDNAEEIETSPESMKVKLKILQNEFNEEMKKKTEKIKPRLFGCIWANSDRNKPERCVDTIWNMLNQSAMIYETPVVLKAAEITGNSEKDCEPSVGTKLTKFPDILLPELIKLFHCNEASKQFLVKEFFAHVAKKFGEKQEVSKSATLRKIHEIAQYKMIHDDTLGTSKRCWFVEQPYREACSLTDLPVINTWTYNLKRRKPQRISDSNEASITSKGNAVTVPSSNISQFTKILTNADRKKQFEVSKLDVKKDSAPAIVKKRVSLISVPAGSKFPAKEETSDKNLNEDNKNKILVTPATETSSELKHVENSAKSLLNSSNKTVQSKSRVNLLASFISRAEKKYSDDNKGFTDIDDVSSKIEAKINEKKKQEIINSTESMDVDDCIVLSD